MCDFGARSPLTSKDLIADNIGSMLFIFSSVIFVHLLLMALANFTPVCDEGYVKEHIPAKYRSAGGVALSTVWYEDLIVHAALVMNSSIS